MHHQIHNYPLIMCDARSVNMDRLIAVDQVYRHFVGDVYYAPYDPSYKWYFQSQMRPDEAVIFKSWDTAPGSSARGELFYHVVTSSQQSLLTGSLSALLVCVATAGTSGQVRAEDEYRVQDTGLFERVKGLEIQSNGWYIVLKNT